jgi:hypothetical protein
LPGEELSGRQNANGFYRGMQRMTCFRDFTVPLHEIFGGNLLMFVAIVFYIVWWTTSKGDITAAGTGFFIAATLFTGVAAIAVISLGIASLSGDCKGFPGIYILTGSVVLFIMLLAVTKIAFHRDVTSELFFIIIWAALEWATIAVLHGCGRFGMKLALMLATLVALATVAGVICYILHYTLDENARFWNGLIPLIVDEGVVTVFLAALALSSDELTFT